LAPCGPLRVVRVLRAAGAAVVLLACSAAWSGPGQAAVGPLPAPHPPWRVGDFTLRWVHGPTGLPRSPRALATGGAVFTIGARAPHGIAARLPVGGSSLATPAPCPRDPFWQVDVRGWSPVMLCEGSNGLTAYLFLAIGAGDDLGEAEVPLGAKLDPRAIGAVSLGGYVLSDSLVWWFRGLGGDVLASGVASTYVTGYTYLPKGLLPQGGGQRIISTDGALYVLRRQGDALAVSRFAPWHLGAGRQVSPQLTRLGKVPAQRVWGVDAGGGAWMTSTGRGVVELARAVPGGAVRTWRVRGRLVGAGPGYVVYLNGRAADAELRIDFPQEDRTVALRGLRRPYATMRRAGDGSAYLTVDCATGRRVLRVAWSPPQLPPVP